MENILKSQSELEAVVLGRLAEVEKQVAAAKKSSAVLPKLGSVELEIQNIKEFSLTMFSLLRQQIAEVSDRCDSMDARSRSNILLLRGVDEVPNEDTTLTAVNIIRDRLGILDAGAVPFRRCHRLGRKSDGSHRVILMDFNDGQLRSRVWKHKTKLKGSALSVCEFLTKVRQSVFVEARKHFGMSACWSHNGSVFVRLPDGSRKTVNRLADLQQLCKDFPQSHAGEAPATMVVAAAPRIPSETNAARPRRDNKKK